MIQHSSFIVHRLSASVIVACVLFYQGSVGGKANDLQKDSNPSTPLGTSLQIYLPREITIQDNNLKLGQVSVVRGDETLVAKASEIALGRFVVPGQEIVIDRPTLLSRLVCNGIPQSQVTLTGAEEITVKKQYQVIKGSEFVEMACSFLKNNQPFESVCEFNPVGIPKDLILPGSSDDITLSPHLVKSGARNQAKVVISVLSSGKEIGAGEVTLCLKFNYSMAVTLNEIPAGAVISPENVKIEKAASDYQGPVDWSGFPFCNKSQNGDPSPPYGLIAKRKLPANTIIHPDMVAPAKAGVSIKRNETVVIRIEKPGILITAVGKAMQEGRAGECIKIRNVDSQRIILAKVSEDGTVEPVF